MMLSAFQVEWKDKGSFHSLDLIINECLLIVLLVLKYDVVVTITASLCDLHSWRHC